MKHLYKLQMETLLTLCIILTLCVILMLLATSVFFNCGLMFSSDSFFGSAFLSVSLGLFIWIMPKILLDCHNRKLSRVALAFVVAQTPQGVRCRQKIYSLIDLSPSDIEYLECMVERYLEDGARLRLEIEKAGLV